MSEKKISLDYKIEYLASCENKVDVEVGNSTIAVKNLISIEEMISFVENAVGMCFSSDGVYMPELRDLAIRGNIIARYTNIKMPTETPLIYALVYDNEIFDKVMEHVNGAQVKSIVYGIDKRIELINSSNIASVNRDISTVYQKMNEFADKISLLFDGVTNEDLLAISNAVVNGTIDEKKLVEEMHKMSIGEQNG